MRSAFSLLFLLPLVWAESPNPEWYHQAHELSDESKTDAIIGKLKTDPKLAGELCEAVKAGHHETEALDLIMRLNIQKCWPEVFSLAKSDANWLAVTAADSLNRADVKLEWKKWLEDAATANRWSKFEPETKMALTTALSNQKIILSAPKLQLMLADPISEVAVSAVKLLEAGMQKNAHDASLRRLMKKTLTNEVVQIRMTAFGSLERASKELKKQYIREIVTCEKNEPDKGVKETCTRLRKSF